MKEHSVADHNTRYHIYHKYSSLKNSLSGQVKLAYKWMFFNRFLCNSTEPDQTAPKEQSDLGLHYCTGILAKYLW